MDMQRKILVNFSVTQESDSLDKYLSIKCSWYTALFNWHFPFILAFASCEIKIPPLVWASLYHCKREALNRIISPGP